jgi:hypothetical protein
MRDCSIAAKSLFRLYRRNGPFSWRDWGKLWSLLVRIFSPWTEIWTRDFQNTKQRIHIPLSSPGSLESTFLGLTADITLQFARWDWVKPFKFLGEVVSLPKFKLGTMKYGWWQLRSVPVTGHGGPNCSETSRIPHLPENLLTDGVEVVSRKSRTRFS